MSKESAPLISRPIWLVVLLAAVLRLAWTAFASVEPTGLTDPIIYYHAAQEIGAGRGYRSITGHLTAFYPPGYPYFLGALQWLLAALGLQVSLATAAGVVQSVLGGLTAGAVAVTASRVAASAQLPRIRAVATFAGLAFALWPNTIFYSSAILSEALYMACFSVFVAAVVVMDPIDARQSGNRAGLIGALGVATLALAFATTIRPQVLLALPSVAMVWLLTGVAWRRVVQRTATLVLGLVLVLTPWTIRNYSVFGHFVPLSTNGGDNLCLGFHPDAPGTFSNHPYCATEEFYLQGPDPEYRRDLESRRRAVAWIVANPGELPQLTLRKLKRTFESDYDGLDGVECYGQCQIFSATVRSRLRRFANTAYALFGIATLVGIGIALRQLASQGLKARALANVLVLLACGIAVPMLFFGDPRFKVPLIPLFAVFVGIAAAGIFKRDEPDSDRTFTA